MWYTITWVTRHGGGRPRTGSRASGPHRRRARYRAGSVPAPVVCTRRTAATAAGGRARGAHARALVPPRVRCLDVYALFRRVHGDDACVYVRVGPVSGPPPPVLPPVSRPPVRRRPLG